MSQEAAGECSGEGAAPALGSLEGIVGLGRAELDRLGQGRLGQGRLGLGKVELDRLGPVWQQL